MSLSTTEQNISAFLFSFLRVRCLSCRLMKGRSNVTPSYLSFKIGLSYDDFSRVILQNAWPPGMLVREFVDKTENLAVLPMLNQLQQPPQPAQLQNFYMN
jgi:hypothetical protein